MTSLLRRYLPLGLLLVLAMSWAQPRFAEAQRPMGRTSKSQVSGQRARTVAKFSSASRRTTSKPSSRTSTTTLRAAKTGKAGKASQAQWQKRRTFDAHDTGLKDHASRHSDLGSEAYLQLGQKNVSHGRMLKGGGRHKDARYHIRKLDGGDYSMTITNKKGRIVSIDTWKSEGTPLTKEMIERGLKASGVTAPRKFWNKL